MKMLVMIDRWHRTHGYAPTIREIGGICGWSSVSTTWHHLYASRKDGLLDWVDGQVRTIHLTPEGLETLKHESR